MSTSLKYEPASESMHISVKQLFLVGLASLNPRLIGNNKQQQHYTGA